MSAASLAPRDPKRLRGLSWFQRVSVGFSGFQQVSVGFSGFQWVSVGFGGFRWVVLGCAGLCWVVIGFRPPVLVDAPLDQGWPPNCFCWRCVMSLVLSEVVGCWLVAVRKLWRCAQPESGRAHRTTSRPTCSLGARKSLKTGGRSGHAPPYQFGSTPRARARGKRKF